MSAVSPRPAPVILPAGLRGPSAIVAALAVLIVSLFGVRYADETAARWLDRRVQSLVDHQGQGPSLADAVIVFGNEVSVVLLAVLLSGLALRLGHRRLAVLAIVGPGLTGLATTVLKPLIGRTFHGAFAFPSGHAGGATALGVVAALVLIAALRTANVASATLLAAGALLPGGSMSVALIADRDHYPTDTLGGVCVAVAIVLLSALAIEWWAERRRLRQPGLPEA